MPTAKSRVPETLSRKAPPSVAARSPRRNAVAVTAQVRATRPRAAPPEPAARAADGEAAAAPVAHLQIAECAYYRAEARGFAPGHELDDWLEAERLLATQATLIESAPMTQGSRRVAAHTRAGGADERA